MYINNVSSREWTQRTNKIIAVAIIIIGLTMMVSNVPNCIFIGVAFVSAAVIWLCYLTLRGRKSEANSPDPNSAISPVLFLIGGYRQSFRGPTPVDPYDKPPTYDQIVKLDGLPPEYNSIIWEKPPRYEDLRLSFDWNTLGSGTPMELCVADLATLHNVNTTTDDNPMSQTPPRRPKRKYDISPSHSPPCRTKIAVFDSFPPWKRSFRSDKQGNKEAKLSCNSISNYEEKGKVYDSACALPLESKPETDLSLNYEGKDIQCTEKLEPLDIKLENSSPSKGGTKKKIRNREKGNNFELNNSNCDIKINDEQCNVAETSSQTKVPTNNASRSPIMTEILLNAATQWPAYCSDSLDLKDQHTSNKQIEFMSSLALVHRSQECLKNSIGILEEQLDYSLEESKLPVEESEEVPLKSLNSIENRTQSDITNQESVLCSSNVSSSPVTCIEHNPSISTSSLPPSINLPTCLESLQSHNAPTSLPEITHSPLTPQCDNSSLTQTYCKNKLKSNLDKLDTQQLAEDNKNSSIINTVAFDCTAFALDPSLHTQGGFALWTGDDPTLTPTSFKTHTSLNYSYNFIQDNETFESLENENEIQNDFIVHKDLSISKLTHPDFSKHDQFSNIKPKSLPMQSCFENSVCHEKSPHSLPAEVDNSLSLQNIPHSLPIELTNPLDELDIEHISLLFRDSDAHEEDNNLEIFDDIEDSLEYISDEYYSLPPV